MINTLDAEQYISQIPMWTKKKNSLEDIRLFLDELGSPDRSMKLIHVAGTNGKGSVCAFLTSILNIGGEKVGTFTSPHLVDVRERICLNGTPVGKELFEAAFLRVYSLSRRMMERGYCHPSYFEFLFYMALEVFFRWGAGWTILETGIGGRFDTTNAVENPKLCIITSIGMDHMEYLGETVEQIAWQKAGIIKTGVPVVYDADNGPAASVIEAEAKKKNAPSFAVSKREIRIRERGADWLLMELPDGAVCHVPFAAAYQAANGAAAIEGIRVLNKRLELRIGREEIQEGIKSTAWPGRMEPVLPGVYLDGAHNAPGMEAFLETAGELKRQISGRTLLLFAAVSDKDYETMIDSALRNLEPDEIVTAHMGSVRALSLGDLEAAFHRKANCPVKAFKSVAEAVAYALSVKKDGDLLFCAGSLYLIGEIKNVLKRREGTHD